MSVSRVYPRILFCLLLSLALPTLAQAPLANAASESRPEDSIVQPAPMPLLTIVFNGRPQQIPVENLANPMVIIQTTRGNLLLELFPAEAPATVANFIGLAEGTKAWTDPRTGQPQLLPLYDGLPIHKVMRGFMIQGGSITGDDSGYPGFFIPDEINATSLGLDRMDLLDPSGVPNPVLGIRSQADFQEQVLKPLYEAMRITSHAQIETQVTAIDQRLRGMTVKQLYELQGYRYREDLQSRAPVEGVIAMANDGPNTNGSQFFITLADTEWLLGRHTVFGKVRAGVEVLDSISRTPVDASYRPQAEIIILGIRKLVTSVTP